MSAEMTTRNTKNEILDAYHGLLKKLREQKPVDRQAEKEKTEKTSDKVRLPLARLYVIVAAVVLLSALWIFLKKTRFGWALRAAAQDPEAAALQGISITQTARIAMFIGAGLAGIAGALTAPLVSVNPHMGHSVIVTAFIVIIVGGVGSLEGAVIASVVYAFVHTFVTTFWDGVIADIVGLSLMLLVLIIKPTGLFGSADRA